MQTTITQTDESAKSKHHGKSILELERERNQMELNLLADIMIFNQRVSEQIHNLEGSIRDEISEIQIE